MNKIKNYLIGVLGVFFLLLLFQFNFVHKKYEKEKTDRERLQENINQLIAEKKAQTTLILKQNELTGKILAQRDSLAKALKIRPKTITKIVEKEVKETIIDTIQVDSEWRLDYIWDIIDEEKCWIWKGQVETFPDSISVQRTYFDYHNKTTDVYWSERPHKFLFIKYGKKKVYQKSLPECGEAITRALEILKN